MSVDLDFYRGKRVLITGHTGFKGAWLSVILAGCGADVIGYSDRELPGDNLFDLCGIRKDITDIRGDVRDYEHLKKVFDEYHPEIVFHLAAQPIVRDSYKIPADTYSINVMGTVNVLECVRNTEGVKSVLNVTTDKVYLNREWDRGYVESDELDGEFVDSVKNYNTNNRPRVLERINQYSDKQTLIFSSREEANAFLESI